MLEINLECFLSKEITIKLGKDVFVLVQPTVREFAKILSKMDKIGNDDVQNTKIMIEILQSFIKYPWWFWYTRSKFGYILRGLTPENLMKVWNEIFFWLGLNKEPIPDLQQTQQA